MVDWRGFSITAETLEVAHRTAPLERTLAERKSLAHLAKGSFSAIDIIFFHQHESE